MYRKGRCRHGHKCSFAHDTDVKTEKKPEPKYDADSQITSKEKVPGSGPVIQLAPPPRELSPSKVDVLPSPTYGLILESARMFIRFPFRLLPTLNSSGFA